MKQFSSLYFLSMLLVLQIASKAKTTANYEKPNIIFILADDLGYGDLSCYNKVSKISTPNLDQLAAGGMMFTNAHAAASVCTPSRYALLTGENPYRSRLKNGGVLWSYDWPLIDSKTITVAQLLKENGYQTALCGKWHLGWQWPVKAGSFIDTAKFGGRDKTQSLEREEKIDLSKQMQSGPLACGFNYYFGVDIPSLPPFCFIENNQVYGKIPDTMKPDNMSGLKGLMQDGWSSENMFPVIMNKTLEYVSAITTTQNQKPFFLLLSLTAPHTPIAPATAFKGKSQAGDYGDFVFEIDSYVRKLVQLLETSGQLKNTLIIFSRDNGPINVGGDLYGSNAELSNFGSLTEYYNHASASHLRGMKGDAWEGGHRIPFIAYWQNLIPAQSSNDNVITLTDFFRTCAGILGISVADTVARDSHNIFPLLKNQRIKNYKLRYIITQSSKGIYSIENGKWQYIAGNNSGGGLFNYYHPDSVTYAEPGQLYNMQKDIGEHVNLYASKQNRVKKLSALLNKAINN